MNHLDESFVYAGHRSEIQMLVAPDLVQQVTLMAAKRKLNIQLVVDDYSQIIAAEKFVPLESRNQSFSWTAYYDIEPIYEYLKKMNKYYPDSTELIVAGQTYEGRQILGLKIHTKTGNPHKPVIFIESGIHAREWITTATTTYFINQLLTSSDPDIKAMRDQFEWHICPSANPDGYHYSFKIDRMWRKTRSKSPNGCYGTDPNRNWDYKWLKIGASKDPCSDIYGGSKPFSEVETRTLSKYVSSLKNLTGYISFHSNGQMLLVPYSDSKAHLNNYDDLVKIGRTSLDYGYKVNHAKYDGPGTAADILYAVSGASMDWVKDTLGTPLTFTYELRGLNFNWPPSRIHEQGDEVTQMMLGLVKEARKLGYFSSM